MRILRERFAKVLPGHVVSDKQGGAIHFPKRKRINKLPSPSHRSTPCTSSLVASAADGNPENICKIQRRCQICCCVVIAISYGVLLPGNTTHPSPSRSNQEEPSIRKDLGACDEVVLHHRDVALGHVLRGPNGVGQRLGLEPLHDLRHLFRTSKLVEKLCLDRARTHTVDSDRFHLNGQSTCQSPLCRSNGAHRCKAGNWLQVKHTAGDRE